MLDMRQEVAYIFKDIKDRQRTITAGILNAEHSLSVQDSDKKSKYSMLFAVVNCLTPPPPAHIFSFCMHVSHESMPNMDADVEGDFLTFLRGGISPPPSSSCKTF